MQLTDPKHPINHPNYPILDKFMRAYDMDSVTRYEDKLVYTTRKPGDACDDARALIAKLDLPLTAKLPSSYGNSFVVEVVSC